MKKKLKASGSFKKKQIEEYNLSKDIFPEANVLFKDILSIFITYYVLIFMIKIIQTMNGGVYIQFVMSLVTLWVVISFILYHIRKVNYNNLFK